MAAPTTKTTKPALTPEQIEANRKQREAKKQTQLDAALALGSPWLKLRAEGAAYARQGPRRLRKAVDDSDSCVQPVSAAKVNSFHAANGWTNTWNRRPPR